MKLFLISCLFFTFLSAEYVGKFGYINGEVYVVRNGKMLRAFQGFKIDEYDTIHSKNFSKSKIIFNNNFIFNIDGKKMIYVKKLMDNTPVMRVETRKNLDRNIVNNRKQNDYRYNSKFNERREKMEREEMQERKKEEKSRVIDDYHHDYHIDKESRNIVNMINNEESHLEIGKVIVKENAKARGVSIHSTSKNVRNYSNKDSISKVNMGTVNVK